MEGPVRASSGVASARESTAAPSAEPTFPENTKQLILRTAKEKGTAPAGDRFTLLRFSNGYGPELLWRAEKTGDICTASDVVARGCVPLADIAKRPTPGVGTFIGASLFEGNWSVMLMANGETVDRLSCQGRDFPVREGYSILVDGVLHTVYTVAIPRNLQGAYRVAVRRDGHPVEEPLNLNLEENYGSAAVQC
ncbi:hypothetical protein [Kitasatospora cathayae]|uniref:Uncharacterized protein n=1 Tax=Kitasatospora cathayae TaxID=3004092 RepID=A0ABY7Q0A8_9ACTN|nr:hypothetical protein [Kitasatospora sp. HUAS 3-15]WBP86123.1 hypothetical protein O1G21_09910 [Kitasatospora sp. HUAS 3-15]